MAAGNHGDRAGRVPHLRTGPSDNARFFIVVASSGSSQTRFITALDILIGMDDDVWISMFSPDVREERHKTNRIGAN